MLSQMHAFFIGFSFLPPMIQVFVPIMMPTGQGTSLIVVLSLDNSFCKVMHIFLGEVKSKPLFLDPILKLSVMLQLTPLHNSYSWTLLKDMGVHTSANTLIYCDNQIVTQIAHNDHVFHEQTKHIKIDYHLICHYLPHGFL